MFSTSKWAFHILASMRPEYKAASPEAGLVMGSRNFRTDMAASWLFHAPI
jgi:hypothetical protein